MNAGSGLCRVSPASERVSHRRGAAVPALLLSGIAVGPGACSSFRR